MALCSDNKIIWNKKTANYKGWLVYYVKEIIFCHQQKWDVCYMPLPCQTIVKIKCWYLNCVEIVSRTIMPELTLFRAISKSNSQKYSSNDFNRKSKADNPNNIIGTVWLKYTNLYTRLLSKFSLYSNMRKLFEKLPFSPFC